MTFGQAKILDSSIQSTRKRPSQGDSKCVNSARIVANGAMAMSLRPNTSGADGNGGTRVNFEQMPARGGLKAIER